LNVHVIPVAAQYAPDVEIADGVPVMVNSPLSHTMQRSGTQSISRTLDVIECFIDVPERGVNEIARLCGLSPSTAHRVVRALVARGYLEQNASRNRYRLGRSAAQFGDAVRRHVPD
jgi:predicted transcriptional regulator